VTHPPTPTTTHTVPPPPPPTTPAGPHPVSLGNATGQVVGYASLCLDDLWSGTQNFNPIDVWSCDGTAAQQWSWVEGGSTLRAFGMCLDVQNGHSDDGTPVDLFQCNGTGSQVFVPRSDGSLFNPQSGKCLDDPGFSSSRGTKLDIWTCDGGANQQWLMP
jgi:hypothetical protein